MELYRNEQYKRLYTAETWDTLMISQIEKDLGKLNQDELDLITMADSWEAVNKVINDKQRRIQCHH